MAKLRHADGSVVECEDDLAKKLLDDGSNIWSSAEKRSRSKKSEEDSEPKE